MSEKWRQVPGWPYEVSNQGQVRKAGRIVSPTKTDHGYLKVWMWDGKTEQPAYVHQLVLWAFVGPQPDGMDTNHRNGVKTDNRLENLEYCTRSENMKHAYDHGLRTATVNGMHTARRQYTEAQKVAVRWYVTDQGLTQTEVARRFGISQSHVSRIVNRRA